MRLREVQRRLDGPAGRNGQTDSQTIDAVKGQLHLSREDQERLSYWAIKTVMALHCVMPKDERLVPSEHYEELMREKCPPQRLRVALARRGYEPEA
jgi:hypothetical protein